MNKGYNIEVNKKIARLIFNKLTDIRKRSLTAPKLMFAESLTGGMISDYITGVAGMSDFYKGSVVAYCNTLKTSILGVSDAVLEAHGAVSAETAYHMALSLGEKYGSDFGAAATGIAGPGGGSSLKPVGLVYFGFYLKGETRTIKKIFNGGRESIRQQSAYFAMAELLKQLNRF